MIKTKTKGIQAERELLHKFWRNGWACVRIAGSGNTSFPAPDLLTGNGEKSIALECKTFKKNYKYLEIEEISQLNLFSLKFGAEPWIAIKFSRQPWYFIHINNLNKTDKKWGVSLALAQKKGLNFEDFLRKNQKI